MTYRARSPYSVLPSPYRVPGISPAGLPDAYDLGGVEGLAVAVRDALWPHVSGRASTPDEVPLLREWLDVAAAEEVARFLRRRGLPEPAPDVVADYLAPEDLTAEEVETMRARVAATLHRRMSTGGVFRECPACSGWFAPQRVRTAADGLVYCSPRCRTRARRAASASA